MSNIHQGVILNSIPQNYALTQVLISVIDTQFRVYLVQLLWIPFDSILFKLSRYGISFIFMSFC
jgi:hypothetical protein